MGEGGFRSGFVAIMGAPNVGKSTLLNRMLGEKLSITSPKPQTTRNRILGVLHRPGAQLVLLDTPGIHKAAGRLNRQMVETALEAAAEVDLVLFVVDAVHPDNVAESHVLAGLQRHGIVAVCVLNKIDLVEKHHLLPLLRKWDEAHPFHALVPVSALKGTQVDVLVEKMIGLMPEGPAYFPDGSLTDLPESFLLAEMIREKVFRLTSREIPYCTAVTVDSFSLGESSPLVRIDATIHVERQSQKAIVIGKGGATLKRIGEKARRDMERMLGTTVFLKLLVRVERNWTGSAKGLRRFGYG